MKAIIILIAALFLFSSAPNAQTRTIYGRALGDDLEPLWSVLIENTDFSLVGKTDSVGRFKISIPQNTQKLFFYWFGYEKATVKFTGNCDTIEVIMLPRPTYDFMSSRKIDGLRLKDFEKLPELHLQAYKKGLFTKSMACYARDFEPQKPWMDSVAKERVKQKKQIKLTFERLQTGDTVKIPFSTEYPSDGTDRTKLIYYSISAYKKKYDCIVTGGIIGKNKHKRGYNLVYKVTDIKLDKYPAVFQGKELKVGNVFIYNMRYFKILNDPVVQKNLTESTAD